MTQLFTWTFETWYQTVAILFVFFNVLYWSTALLSQWLLRRWSARNQIEPLSRRKPLAGQHRLEIRRSMQSITVFSLQGILIQQGLQYGWFSFSFDFSFATLWQVPVLFLWNELHFYIVHRLLHLPVLIKKIHWMHHTSVEPTVFSTYSFHPVEAFLLGTVIFFPLLLYPFEIIALLTLPVISILLNALGHCNYDLFPGLPRNSLLKFSNRHTLHHHTARGNYGFMLPWFDRFFGTTSESANHE